MLLEFEERQLASILESPSAPLLAARLASALEAEHKRRLQFYQDIDDDLKVEFINGEIVVHSPVKKEHTDATGFLYKILDTFVRVFKAGYVGYEKVMTALTRNDYEPDVLFFGPEKAAGFQKGQWKYPPPDFVVEVLSEGAENGDRGIKFNDYAPNGVPEHLRGLTTARLGDQARDIEGNKIEPEYMRPLFIGRAEADAYDRILMRLTIP